MKICTINWNYCLVYVRIVPANSRNIVHSMCSWVSSFMAIVMFYTINGFHSTTYYRFIYLWFKLPHGLITGSGGTELGKGAQMQATAFEHEGPIYVEHTHYCSRQWMVVFWLKKWPSVIYKIAFSGYICNVLIPNWVVVLCVVQWMLWHFCVLMFELLHLLYL